MRQEVPAGAGAKKQQRKSDAVPFAPEFQLQGTASCAAMPCHNGTGQRGSTGREYMTWFVDDKHARAYEVLFDKRSKLMLKYLDGLHDLKTAHPEKDARCLNCHVYPDLNRVARREVFAVQDGVSCEACHGAAEKWLSQHYTRSWQELDAAVKERAGMRDLVSLSGRSRLCASCHVGRPGAEVHHDLIAAGHPPLRFEFAAFHANMPHHWDRARDRKIVPDFEARAWEIGQIVVAQTALDLLSGRAADEQAPWPEFAEYDCFSCHHDLTAKSWRQQTYGVAKGRLPGSYSWGSWYFSSPPHVADLTVSGRRLPSLAGLEREMARISPNRLKIQELARNANEELNKLLHFVDSRHSIDKQAMARKFKRLVDRQRASPAFNWDSAGQLYLGLAALHHAWKDLPGAPEPHNSVAVRLKELEKVLRFPKGSDSPGPDFSPEAVRRQLKSLAAALESTNR